MSKWILKTITVQMKDHETFNISGTFDVVTGILTVIQNDVQAIMIADVEGSGFWSVKEFLKWLELHKEEL